MVIFGQFGACKHLSRQQPQPPPAAAELFFPALVVLRLHGMSLSAHSWTSGLIVSVSWRPERQRGEAPERGVQPSHQCHRGFVPSVMEFDERLEDDTATPFQDVHYKVML